MANGNGDAGACIPFDIIGIWECSCCENNNSEIIAEVNRINKEFVDAGKFNINYSDIRPRVGRNRWFLKGKN